ncbi:hypothetical protein [uncultured Massilia sp.]|uniref:pilus assembly PilX family protein n=1 Tax=uncultured Massilia sp. TaxID=169973 RepID=UPI0025DB83EF|nr:hypothetical protein [uncultured Massilia sp.]
MTRAVPHGRRARGIALPVVLVILALMLVGAVYLLKAVHSTGLTTGNLAYDATLSRQADLGLHSAFQWLDTTAATSKATLDNDSAANGYVARLTTTDLRSGDFWAGSKTITDSDGTRVEYVIHRMCNKSGAYNDPVVNNQCMQTAPNTAALGNALPIGASGAVDAAQYAGSPRLHYVVTARIAGARGASVTNQMIVLIGA